MEIGRVTIVRTINDLSMEQELTIEGEDPSGTALNIVELIGMLEVALHTVRRDRL